jgi:hypothetical protein
MKKVKKYWMVLLFGGLLMAILVGVAGARPNDRPMGALTRRITIPAGHFIPAHSNDTWNNEVHRLYSMTDGATDKFVAPVVFPTGQAVVVESITFWAYDNNAADNLCVYLYRTDPTAANKVEMASACTSGFSTTLPLSFTDSTIDNNPVKHGKGVCLQLETEDNSNLMLYGVRISYHHGTT